MGEAPNELILGVWNLTLSARGAPALWPVIPVSAILVAVAWKIVMVTERRRK